MNRRGSGLTRTRRGGDTTRYLCMVADARVATVSRVGGRDGSGDNGFDSGGVRGRDGSSNNSFDNGSGLDDVKAVEAEDDAMLSTACVCVERQRCPQTKGGVLEDDDIAVAEGDVASLRRGYTLR